MCGRYDNLIARDAYKALYRVGRLPASNFPLRYNVAPTDQIPIVRIDPRDGQREVTMARWGLIPSWMKEKPKVPHINARAETVHKLPLLNGNSELMESNHTDLCEGIWSLLPLPEFGSS
jgi:putative SOS response-associated peptidase YedK